MKPLGKRHNRIVREKLAEQGMELTPDQLIATRKEAYAKIRAALKAKGWNDVPDDDEGLFLLMRRVLRGGQP
jgi:hypothetical protein